MITNVHDGATKDSIGQPGPTKGSFKIQMSMVGSDCKKPGFNLRTWFPDHSPEERTMRELCESLYKELLFGNLAMHWVMIIIL